jgi:hypothetical protein
MFDRKQYDASREARRYLGDGPAAVRARAMKKVSNAKTHAKHNAKHNAKVKDRARDLAEARMLANPSMAIQILPAQNISGQSSQILARTNIIPGLEGTLEELMGGSKVSIYIWLSSRGLPRTRLIAGSLREAQIEPMTQNLTQKHRTQKRPQLGVSSGSCLAYHIQSNFYHECSRESY